MGDNYFDVDEALKDGHSESEVAAHLAQLHGINREDYIKDGLTDADFLSEFKSKPLAGSTQTTTAAAPKDDLSEVSNLDNALFGGIAAAAPGAAGYALNKLKGTMLSVAGVKGVPSADTSTTGTPSKTFASPSQVSARVTAAGQPPRPAGPTDVVNWASGKDERTGQYGRGYLGGQDMKEEHILHQRANELEAKNPGYKIKPGTTNLLIPEAEYKKLVAETKAAETAAKEALSNKSKMAAELRANRLAQVNSSNIPAKIVNNIGNAPVSKRFMTGYNVGDLLQAQNPFEATVSTVGAAAPYGSGLIEKVLPNKFKPVAKLLGPAVGAAAPAINWLERKLIGPQEEPAPEQHAAGGLAGVQHFENGRLAVAKKAADFLFKPRETQIMRASEALAPHEGKHLGLTQTDNFGVHGGRMGGNQFPNFQNINPLHQQHGVVWMNDSPKHAQDMIKRSNDNMIWSTYLGAPDQLKSNKSVAQDILNQHYQRDLSPEQIDLINKRIATLRPSPDKPLVFSQPFDIRDKFAAQELGLDTFARRAALADILGGGKGVGQTKGGIALPQYEDILRSHRDPLTEGAPTSSVGTRLFSVDNSRPTQRTDKFHPDYRDAVFGKDQQVQFERPVPQNLIVPNWYNEINARAPGKTHGNAWFSYMKDPQLITEGLLTNMQKEGFAEGGEVQHFENGRLAVAKKAVGQIPEVAQALEAYLRGHISDVDRINIMNKHLPIRKWDELPPSYTDDQIRAALMENKRPKALADVPAGMQVGNRLDIPAYTQNGVYVDTVHNTKGSPISYNRTGHLKDVEFSSKPNQAVRVGLGTKEQALTPLGAEIGSGKSPFALMKGTNIGTKDDEVRRMLQEYLNDPNWTQIGMDPRRHSQFYDKSTGLPVFSASEKLQSGPLVMVPKGGLETSHWGDPRLQLSDFEGKHYAEGGHATPAWQRSEGKNPEGGLNAAGRASYNREHGGHLKAPQPEGGSRKDSFCARMEGMKKKRTSSKTANDPDSRINKSLRKWKC